VKPTDQQRQDNSDRMKVLWSDPMWREKQRKSIHKHPIKVPMTKSQQRSFLSEHSKRKWQTPEYKNKMAAIHNSHEYRRKLRELTIQRLKDHNISPRANKTACQFFDRLNGIVLWNIQHAGNGGEVVIDGYFLDGYEADLKRVWEYDEPAHNKLCNRIKDMKRQFDLVHSGKVKEIYRYQERSQKVWLTYKDGVFYGDFLGQ
jgi:hypothetical protein